MADYLCPRHHRPVDSCEFCEREIDRLEFERDHPGDEGVAGMEHDYERWLDIGGSGN